jgi:hypothetical protein
LAGTPNFSDRVAPLETEYHYSVSFYVSWFTRCFRNGEAGWFGYQTPDGLPIAQQDAFFWSAMEVICRKLNEMIVLERAKLNGQR